VAPGTAPDAQIAGAETEVFYTFTWGRAPRGNARNANPRRGADKPRGKGKPQGKGRKGAPKADDGGKAQNFSARPPRKEKAIDPDNPFAAALMGLKDNK
jgi:ATP-dependent RNA helicase SUPV3L1/SUV3